jgi:sirohydrochlorin ferrochelatase
VLGNAAQSAANKAAAAERADALRVVFVETAGLSLRAAADALNSRGIATPTGKPWSAMTVARVRAWLKV